MSIGNGQGVTLERTSSNRNWMFVTDSRYVVAILINRGTFSDKSDATINLKLRGKDKGPFIGHYEELFHKVVNVLHKQGFDVSKLRLPRDF